MVTASFKDLETLVAKKRGLPLVHPKSKLKTGTLFCHIAQISDEQEQKLLVLQAEVALNFAATFSAVRSRCATLPTRRYLPDAVCLLALPSVAEQRARGGVEMGQESTDLIALRGQVAKRCADPASVCD